VKGLRRYMILSAVLLVLYVVAQYYKPVPTNWKTTFLKEDKIPFGLYLLHQQIPQLFPGTTLRIAGSPVYNSLSGKNYTHTAYLFIASTVDMDKADFKLLKQFMEGGNDVFIAAFNLGKVLQDTLKVDINSSFNPVKQKGIPVNFTNPYLKSEIPYVFDKGIGDYYFSALDTLRASVLGTNKNEQVNFLKYAFGKGNLYLMANPQLFTNYSLLNPAGADYAAKALSVLKLPRTMIWDEMNTAATQGNRSPLSIIFRYPALTWAYYMALVGLVVFVLFEIKRRQRIIPVVEPLTNSSVEFAEVVGKVYYQQRDNRDISLKKVNYLFESFRQNYRLKAPLLDQEQQDLLVVRSGVPAAVVQDLFKTIRGIQTNTSVSDDVLLELNKQIEEFYAQAQ
jgi:hypothetical protein